MAKQRQECEVYSRVVGYLRPVKNWNDAKQSEFHDRTMFEVGSNNKQDESKSVST